MNGNALFGRLVPVSIGHLAQKANTMADCGGKTTEYPPRREIEHGVETRAFDDNEVQTFLRLFLGEAYWTESPQSVVPDNGNHGDSVPFAGT